MPTIFRRLQGLFTEKPPNYSAVTKKIVASGLPSRETHIKFLENEGVTAIVSLTEKPLPSKLLSGSKMKYFHFPLEDHKPADPKKIFEVASTVRDLVRSGEKVLVHCLAGMGRTGMVLTAYLMLENGGGWRENLDKLRALRPGSVEKNQEITLQLFEKLVKPDS